MGPTITISASLRSTFHFIDDIFSKIIVSFQEADLSIFHQFVPPPAGGGHQFLRALLQESARLGFKIENNTISCTTRACLFNSFNFNEERLRRFRRDSVLYVHRVDGPIDVYRGYDQGVDRHIWQINQEFANKTIFQSDYSLQKHLEIGLQFQNPVIINNAVDETIFNSQGRIPFSQDRKIRLIAASWSSNPKKGSSVYDWLDRNLDWTQYEFTFVGRSPIKFRNIRMIDPVPSSSLAELLRSHDIYLTASQDDPCSNSLLEALSCGCPALYLNSGGHPELVKNAGLKFESPDEVPDLIRNITSSYEAYQAKITVSSIQGITEKYLKVLDLL